MSTVGIDSDSATIPSVNFTEVFLDPAQPAAGHWKLFFKSGGLYIENSTSLVQKLLLPAELAVPVNWTPVVNQAGVVAATVIEAKYALLGKWCQLWASLLVTGTGTAGTEITISGIPAAAQLTALAYRRPVGAGYFQNADPGTLEYWAIAFRGGSTTTLYFRDTMTGQAPGYNPNYALAVNDQIGFSVGYPVP